MNLPFDFNFKKPDYVAVFRYRAEKLAEIRKKPGTIGLLKRYYRDNPAQFIIDWGMTFDPRNVELDLPSVIPFILFPRQIEYVEWFMERWKTRTSGVVAKSREMGLSWLSVALSATLCMFNDGVVAGFGSRKEEYVDKLGEPGSLLEKARFFIANVPYEFSNGWNTKNYGAFKRISFPNSNSLIVGEAGDNIGRGNRTSFFKLDEAAWVQHPEMVDAALSQTTNCRIHISTPRGSANPFAQKWFSAKIPKFAFHWRDDPRKDEEWYARQCEMILDPVIIAQEIDLNFNASMEGIIIPPEWVQAAIDAHIKLGITPTGERIVGFDIADEGRDLNSVAGRHGILLADLKPWSGVGSDIFYSLNTAFGFCDEYGYETIIYDADGLGAGARGDARVINATRKGLGVSEIEACAFWGSGEILDPKKEVFERPAGAVKEKTKARTNIDYFENFKAQSWWDLRRRFLITHRAVKDGMAFKPEEIISISSKLPKLSELSMELSQPTFKYSDNGKIMVNKKPDGARSPNLADSVMIAYSRVKRSRGFFSL
jgi:phage terminase large subunit